MQNQTERSWLVSIATVGVILWVLLAVLGFFEQIPLTEIERLLCFGILVTTPLGLRIAIQPDRAGRIPQYYRQTLRFYPVAALAAVLSMLLTHQIFAGICALIWTMVTISASCYGLHRLLPRPLVAVDELSIDFGLIYMTIGGIWLSAYAFGYPLLSFDPTTVILTAVHFTFISPGALVIMGMIGRSLNGSRAWLFFCWVAGFAIASPALVALGITFTQFAGRLWLEAGAVIILAGSFLILSALYTVGGLPEHLLARVLILPSVGALLITMGFALAYSLGRFTGWWSVPLQSMIRWHGWLNAVGFIGAGLLAWNIAVPTSHVAPAGIPFSQLPWRWQIGPDFFDRIQAIDQHPTKPPTGIAEDLSAYADEDFHPETITPAIKAFYERTAEHALWVYPQWQPRFRLLALVYKRISTRLNQMNFPSSAETKQTLVTSAIVPLRDDLDKREGVRGWVRVYPDSGQAVYVAAYSTHRNAGRCYMNIAFPLPLGNLTSVLKLTTPPETAGGLLLTSFSTPHGDQGVYFASRVTAIRLPINETITVYPSSIGYAGLPPELP
ncbi:MAG: YndJ family protein, partial [Chloroflexota bacterium]